MKKFFLTVLLLLNFSLIIAQTEKEKESSKPETSIDCIKNIKELGVQYQENYKKYKNLQKKIKNLKKQLDSTSLTSHNKIYDSLKTYNDSLIWQHQDTITPIAKKIESYRLVCDSIFIKNKENLDTIFENYKQFLEPIIAKKKEKPKLTTYSYYGENLVVKDDLFEKESTESRILQQIISEKGEESYLGDIYIPKDEQEFYFYEKNPVFILSKIKYPSSYDHTKELSDTLSKEEKEKAKLKKENWLAFRFRDKYIYEEEYKICKDQNDR